ncbi:hypothetical protein K456DRAFT_1731926 [Colletotrichum gloeosporioides 23]|nr:hypothetical protein K456DRAFT_1731926 [Colletotrichum gloeosporioides 23]
MQSRETETTLKKLSTGKVYVTAKSVNQDIESHIRKLDLDQWDGDQRDKIANHLTTNSEGSFRWAVGQLMAIETCDSEDELDEVLAALPSDLTNTYERILSRFKTVSEITKLKTLLCWLLYAGRPLRLDELRQTVAVDWLQKPYFEPKKILNQRPKIIEQCRFLMTVDEVLEDINAFTLADDKTISNSMEGGSMWHRGAVLRLAHSSVVQFL